MAFDWCGIYPSKIQKLRHDFQRSLHSSAAASQSIEKDPVEADTTAPCSTSPLQVLPSYQQHVADHVHLFMEKGEELTLSEDWAAPLVVEVFLQYYFIDLFAVSFLSHVIHLIQSTIQSPNVHFQALQKIHLADHIKQMAHLMHVDTIQQLEVALLGSPAAEVTDLLLSDLSKSKQATVTTAPPHPCIYTATPLAPPLASVPVVGVSDSSPVPVMVTVESKPDEEIPTTSKAIKTKISNIVM